MDAIDATTISTVTAVLGPERDRLVSLLRSLEPDEWNLPTECPLYPIQGIAAHILGDDLSLLSRQRDSALPGLFLVAEDMPGVDFRTLLNTFNDQWVRAARFFSPTVLIELLELAGQWTSDYYTTVDPEQMGEPVPLFSPEDGTSPMWQAIAREYLERWAHHSQILRALGRGSLGDPPFLDVGAAIVGTVAQATVRGPKPGDDTWVLGPITLGSTQQTADILTLAHTSEEVAALIDGPTDAVESLAARTGRL